MVETNELDIIPMKAMTAPKKALLRIPMTLTKALEIGDKKNVSATCREPTHAETVKKQRKCFFHNDLNSEMFFAHTPNLKERFSSPELSNFLFNATKTIPKMFNIPNRVPFAQKEVAQTTHAKHPPSLGENSDPSGAVDESSGVFSSTVVRRVCSLLTVARLSRFSSSLILSKTHGDFFGVFCVILRVRHLWDSLAYSTNNNLTNEV